MIPIAAGLAAGSLTFTTVDGRTVTLPDPDGRPFIVEMVRSLDW